MAMVVLAGDGDSPQQNMQPKIQQNGHHQVKIMFGLVCLL